MLKSNGASDVAARPFLITCDQSAAAECCVEARCFSIAFSSFGGDIGVSVIRHSDRAINRIRYRSRRRHDGDLADAAHAQRMARVRYLDDTRFDHRQIEAGRHAVVEEAGLRNMPLSS